MAVRRLGERVAAELEVAVTALPICLWGVWDEYLRPRVAGLLDEAAAVHRSRRR